MVNRERVTRLFEREGEKKRDFDKQRPHNGRKGRPRVINESLSVNNYASSSEEKRGMSQEKKHERIYHGSIKKKN